MNFPWIAESEFTRLASQGYSQKALADLAGADYDTPTCPECGAPDFCCMGEHDVYDAAAEHDEQIAAQMDDDLDPMPF